MPRGVPNKPKTAFVCCRHRFERAGVLRDPGEVLELPVDEAENLVHNGLADPVEGPFDPAEDEGVEPDDESGDPA